MEEKKITWEMRVWREAINAIARKNYRKLRKSKRYIKKYQEKKRKYYREVDLGKRQKWERRRNLKNKNLTFEQYEQILKEQDGCCAICKRDKPISRKHFDVDHDHKCCSGSNSCGVCIRGLLCQMCNKMLGNAKDDVDILRAAIKYLEDTRIEA